GLHHLPLQSRGVPGRAGQGSRPREHALPVRTGRRQRGRGGGQRGGRIRWRDPHRRQPVRCAEGRLLRQVLIAVGHHKEIVMTIKIDKKIKAYQVLKPEQTEPSEVADATAKPAAEVIQMTEALARPQTLVGATYKIKSPLL